MLTSALPQDTLPPLLGQSACKHHRLHSPKGGVSELSASHLREGFETRLKV